MGGEGRARWGARTVRVGRGGLLDGLYGMDGLAVNERVLNCFDPSFELSGYADCVGVRYCFPVFSLALMFPALNNISKRPCIVLNSNDPQADKS